MRAARYLLEGAADFVWANEANQELFETLLNNVQQAASAAGQAFEDHRCSDLLPEWAAPHSWRLQEGLPLHGREAGPHPGWRRCPRSDKDSGSSALGWRVTHWESKSLLGYCQAVNRQFDFVDIDASIASGCSHIGATLELVRPGGLLYLAATGLTATKPSLAFQSLGVRLARCPPTETLHDHMARALIWRMVSAADSLGLIAQPLFSLYRGTGDVFRILFRVVRRSGESTLRAFCCGICCDCNVYVGPLEEEGLLGARHARPRCRNCHSSDFVCWGPLWTGSLNSDPFLAQLQADAAMRGWLQDFVMLAMLANLQQLEQILLMHLVLLACSGRQPHVTTRRAAAKASGRGISRGRCRGYGRNASSVDAALASSGAAWRTAVPCALNSQSGWPKQDGLDALSLDVAMSVMSFRIRYLMLTPVEPRALKQKAGAVDAVAQEHFRTSADVSEVVTIAQNLSLNRRYPGAMQAALEAPMNCALHEKRCLFVESAGELANWDPDSRRTYCKETSSSNNSEHLEAKLPAPPRLASLAETAKEIAKIKQKLHGEYVTYINGREVTVTGDSRKADIAMCVFSSLLATHQLASAGMSINAAVATCGWDGNGTKVEACAANIGTTLATLSGTACFLTELALNCPSENVDWRAGCAKPIETLLSGLGGLVGHSSGISQACDEIENGATIFNPVNVNDETGLANCILNADQAAFFAGRAGLNVNALANGDCSDSNSAAGCSASVTGALTSFASMASFLAGAVSKCTKYKLYSPACAANIAGCLLKCVAF
ncbi:unnamed protein product [Symbiodinium natans]|uniref:Uncharacterized protein n=1 Tax=Symbiodinium natans TaxID=878477 RepID=A0A812NFX7_9DINO|nr:unnamed protein product [Symbiodinium natans]